MDSKFIGRFSIVCNRELTVVSYSPTVEIFFGWRENGLVGQNVADFISDNKLTSQLESFVKRRKDEITIRGIKLFKDNKSDIKKDLIIRAIEDTDLITLIFSDNNPHSNEKQLTLVDCTGKYQSLYDNMINAAVFFEIITDIHGRAIDLYILEVNNAFERISGIPKDMAAGKTFLEIFSNVGRENFYDYANRIISGETVHQDLYFSPLKKHLHIVAYKPEKSLHVAIISDVTERKLAEEALRESEKSYKLIAESTSDVIWVMDLNMKNTYVSPSTLRFRGYTVEEHLMQNHDEILTPESFSYVKRKLNEALEDFMQNKNTVPLVLEVEYKHKSRGVIWAEVNVSFIFDQGGNIFGFHGVSRNIEDRKKIEHALSESEKRFKSLLMAMPDIMLIISKDGQYKDVFTSKPELLSLHPKDLLKSNVRERLPKDMADKAMNIIDIVIKENKMQQFEYPVDLQKGTRWFQANIVPYDSFDGRHVLWLARDITNIKKVEYDLITAKQEAEASDKLKSNFLANMSHEIRTPMNGILGFTSLLKVEGLTIKERNEYIKMINNSAEILLKLIDDIIDISKIEADQIKVEVTEYHIESLMNDLFTLFDEIKNSRGKEHIVLRLVKPDDAGSLQITTDSMRFTQIMTNLIGNAFKFTDKGYIELGYRLKDPRTFEFYVKDTGIGIVQGKQEIIFERFRQADDSSTRAFGGTGLGLAISKGLVKLLGGEIKVESEPGKGTTFLFTLPRNNTLTKSSHIFKGENSNNIYDWTGKTLLIAEDNEISFRLIEVILRNTKARLLHAKNGKEAIEFIQTEPKIDLVLMDIHMPIMDGMEATIQIKKIHKDLPIIAQTAYAMKEEKDKCIEIGCDAIITKPINSSKLLSCLDSFL